MKNLLKPKSLPLATVILGGIGFVLRWLLYMTATDERNLVSLWHPLELLLWLVAATATLLIIGTVWKLRNPNHSPDRFRPSAAQAAGSAAMAAGILLAVLQGGLAPSGLEMVRDYLGVLAAAAMLVVAFNRFQGRQPFFLLHAAVCIFFAVHMVSCYRGWSSNPQLMDYIFTLFASVGLMLFAFYHACLEADMGKLRLLPGAGLLTAFCCIVALSGTEYLPLYLGGGIWTLTNLCRLHTGE